jgi:hypothetical protein
MNRGQFVLILFSLILMICSCAPLSKSQVKLSHNYFETIANYPRYYRELNKNVAALNLEAKNLESSLQDSDSIRVATIINSISEYEASMKLPDSIQFHAKFLDSYIQNYYLMIPNGFNVYQALKGTTETIGGIFGLGGVVKGILPNNVATVSSKKKKKIRKHIFDSHKQLNLSLNVLHDYMISTYNLKLEEIDKKTIEDFETLLNSVSKETTSLEYYTKHNRMLTVFYRKLFLTKNLSTQFSQSIESFIKTENGISKNFKDKQKVDMESSKLSDLINDMQKIRFLIEDLNDK